MDWKGLWENQYGSVIEITGAGNRQVAGRQETLWYMLSEKEGQKTNWCGAMRTNAETSGSYNDALISARPCNS